MLTREDVVRWFRAYALEEVRKDPLWLRHLVGRDLECWCDLCELHRAGLPVGVACPDCAPCHADSLLVMVETWTRELAAVGIQAATMQIRP